MRGDLQRYAAVNARVRTLLASLLGRTGLEALYSYPTPEAVLEALLRTPYGATPSATGISEISLIGRLAAVGQTLLRMLPDAERAFLHTYLLHHEVENLKLVIRAVHGGIPWAEVVPLASTLSGIATISPESLVDTHDLRELTDRLAATAYGPPLRAALHRVDEAGPFALEVAVELDYYDRLWLAADALASADRERARHLLGILYDILNLTWIARYRTPPVLSPEEILNYTLRQGRWLTLAMRRRLAEEAEPAWDVALTRTPYAPLLADAAVQGFDTAASALWRFLAHEVQRTLSGYPFHIGVPLGLLLAYDIEIRDLRILLAAKCMGIMTAEAFEHVATVRH
jgi:V/A-type H+/Na+-transporting ATPase subunit C